MKRRNAPNPTRDRILRFLADNPGATRPEVRAGVIALFRSDGRQVPGGPEMTGMRVINTMADMERRGALKRDGNRWRLAEA